MSFIATAFTLVSEHRELEIKILVCSTEMYAMCIVQYSTQRHDHLERMHACDLTCEHMFASLKACNLKVYM